MSIAYYVCYNEVSYVVAAEHALRSADDSTILYASDRIAVRKRYERLRHRRLTRAQLLLAGLRLTLSDRSVVYVPHHRIPRSVVWLLRRASSWALVDDGLDTLREQPKNIDVHALAKRPVLLTFTDYSQLGAWTREVNAVQVCGLERLACEHGDRIDLQAYRTIIVDSPGVDPSQLPTDLARDPTTMLVFVHGNPKKRSALRLDGATTASGRYSVEKVVSDFEGAVVCGESMVAVFALHCARKCRLTIQLRQTQLDNLVALHEVIYSSGAHLQIV
jgi:hypothetical protein